ncbi:two-component system response regulator TorR [Aromatoleum evansii]|uniref:two-component system response regulator TorR n=1 Tax=Aromatoleum evansii TaxID=59406 RepID=UPI00145CBA15|nr:two-component system response regulator TorR [Aromatoleum evansii]NMG32506.1 two-component system response regulator TorR [Aromatoleum evansii]
MIENRPARLLVVDDDPVTRARLEAYFSNEGYEMLAVSNGEDMWRTLQAEPIDVVLLDVGLPGKDGLELARELRAHDERLGIILVTGRSDEIDKIVGLESGADDYVTKPFNARELLARVKIILRGNRNRPATQERSAYRFGGWTLEVGHRRLVASDGSRESLTRGEFELLASFVRRPGVVLSRERLMQTVSHRAWDPNDRTIDVLISRLREKLEDDPRNPELIVTVRGEGYLFAGDVTAV